MEREAIPAATRADLRVEELRGARLLDALDAIAALRIAVFRDWPYLYDGDRDYEARYLAAYAAPGALCVAVWHGTEMVGASTGAPMTDHAEDFATGLPPDWAVEDVFYCAESVLLPGYRGLGLGHAFFDRRETAARAQGLGRAVFASVLRSADHPARPPDYRPLDPFWEARGYAKLPGALARFAWKDVGEAGESEKPLQLWGRVL
ncbi:MAG: GNAT family N-acetyltransferase [Pseudomonadota bacterium]